jgi:4-amino-4-deoxy-L-arabinose transferase-like glycosyltransferase
MRSRISSNRWRPTDSAAALAVVVVALLSRVPTLTQPLLGLHGFRQTQTAYTALLLHEGSGSVMDPFLPVLGTPWMVPFEFPLFEWLAARLMDAGVAADVAVRLTSLVCFGATAMVLWALVRRKASGIAAALAVAWFCFCPLSIEWSRGGLMEYLATAAAVGSLYAAVRWLESRTSIAWLVAAVLLGSVASLVKITTWAGWAIPIGSCLIAALRQREPSRSRRYEAGAGAAILAIPAVLALAWTYHADAIKAASVWTADLTSGALFEWNFGTLLERLDPSAWLTLGSTELFLVLGVTMAVLLIPAVDWIRRSADRLFWVGIAGAAVVAPLVFFGVYVRHDYYSIAVSPAWAALVGIGGAALLAVPVGRRPRAVMIVALALAGIAATAPYWGLAYAGPVDPGDILGHAAEIDRLTAPGSVVVIEGDDWSPETLYYARRSGYALPVQPLTPSQMASLASQTPGLVMLLHPATSRVSILGSWDWIAPVTPDAYRVGDRPTAMGSGVLWSRSTPQSARTAPAISSLTIACGSGPTGVLSDTGQGAWLLIEPASEPEARLWVADDLAPIPVRGAVWLPPGTVPRLRCMGASAVTVRDVAGIGPTAP